jgi:acyl-CoA dehydrogenase
MSATAGDSVTTGTTGATGVEYVSSWKDDEVRALGALADKFIAAELTAKRDTWESQHYVDPEVWRRAGEIGLLCCSIPAEYGGGGGTFAHDLAVFESQARAGDHAWGNGVHSGIVAHYILAYGTEDQRQRWLPGLASGEQVAAVAMTEPGAGSDLKNISTRAVRDGDEYVIDGAKTFITNGHTADLIVVVAKTDPSAGAKGISLLVVEARDCPGFVRGRILDKIGQHGADTSELYFDGVRVPVANLLGGAEGRGFGQLMTQLAQERLIIAVGAVAGMEAAVEHTVAYVKHREAFGQRLFDFQNTKFTLAECATTAHVGRVFVDSCIQRHLDGGLDATTAAMAKWWLTEQQVTVIDRCLQLYGGYGYMREYPIARMYADARVQKIYGGANEIMKDLVARSLR